MTHACDARPRLSRVVASRAVCFVLLEEEERSHSTVKERNRTPDREKERTEGNHAWHFSTVSLRDS
ncbi:conserved hypothetical protein [Ricinus communis]|uniref:Uncharacterized protein n=1 Tax=Ricinus communis TaxID=3988 RepID=B9RRL6_RICCO|nr:conserved hypothetical protein [Ricinus communis]